MASLSNSALKCIVFSYHKNHQELVLKIYNYFKNVNLPVWIDIQDKINNDIYQSTNDIVEKISVLVCFMTPMYQASKHCQQEVQFVKNEGIPVIGVRLLPNWNPSGWLNKITTHLLTIDLRGINQRNFENKTNKLRDKIIGLLDKSINCRMESHSTVNESLIDRSLVSNDSNTFSLVDNVDLNCTKKKPVNYRVLPNKCRLNLSNLMICNNEYILINANKSLHLFDRNLNLIRSNNDIKIDENDLKDLSWSSDLNSFIILTKKKVYLMNSLTTKLSIIENLKVKDQREEFVSCSCSDEKLFVITSQLNAKSFYLEEYYFLTFRFLKKSPMIDLIGTNLSIQNGICNKNHIQQISSIRYYQKKLLIIMQISFNWFIYVFHLYEQQPVFLIKIPLEDKSRITILNSINQGIIFKDYLSNSFIQISMDFKNKYQNNQQYELEDYSKGSIHFNGKLRSVSLLGTSNLVLLINNALVLYKL